MAIQPRISRILLDNGLGSTREWIATAVTQDTAAGSSVDITVTMTSAGAAPPGQAELLELRMVDSGGGAIRTFSLTPGSASQTVTFFFTANGQSGGGNRCGTVEMILHADRDSVTAYDVESDGSPNSPPAGFTATLDRGWIRGTTTGTHSVSNVSFGGAKPNPFSYDDDVFHRIVLGAQPFRSESITLTVGAVLSQAVSSSSATFQHQHVDVVDERFAAASTSLSTGQTVPNNSGLATGQPWTVLTTVTQDVADYDPRLTCAHLNQYDSNTFATPPLSADASNERLTSQNGFVATRLRNARGEGINGLAVTQSLTPVNPGTAKSGSSTTATRGGEAGWTDFLNWDSALPGGTWTKLADVTTADIDGDSYLIGASEGITLLASNPAMQVRVGIHKIASTGTHLTSGDTLRVAVDVQDASVPSRATPDSGTVVVSLTRYDATSGRLQGWTGTAWANLGAPDEPVEFEMTAIAGDAALFVKDFAADATWADHDVRACVRLEVGGVPYAGYAEREILSAKNRHDRHEVNPVGLVLGKLGSQR